MEVDLAAYHPAPRSERAPPVLGITPPVAPVTAARGALTLAERAAVRPRSPGRRQGDRNHASLAVLPVRECGFTSAPCVQVHVVGGHRLFVCDGGFGLSKHSFYNFKHLVNVMNGVNVHGCV